MSTQAVVNTNVSSVSDINALRGNLPSGVYAHDMEAGGAVADAQVFTLADGLETVGAYSGSVLGAGPTAAGVQQLITINFATAFEWKSSTHYIEVSFEPGFANAITDEAVALNTSAGTGSAAFNDSTQKAITIVRKAGKVLNSGGATSLTAATMLVRVVKRGLEVA
jgi:hypothetical protein